MPLVWVSGAGGAVIEVNGVGSVQAISEAKKREASQLLPHGPAWSRRPDSVMQRLTCGLSGEFARVDFALAQLEREAFPDITDEALEEWEAFAGLPGDCEDPPVGVEDRRDALVAKLYRSRGPLTRQRFIDIATELGYTTIEFKSTYWPFRCGARCGTRLGGTEGGWQFTAQVDVGPSGINDGILRCIIRDAAHLGTTVFVNILL